MEAVAAYLTTVRRSQKMSRAKLAELAGTTEMTILRIEKQGQEPAGPLLVRIVDALKAPWDIVTRLMKDETADVEDALEHVLNEARENNATIVNPDFNRFLDLVAGGVSPQDAARILRNEP